MRFRHILPLAALSAAPLPAAEPVEIPVSRSDVFSLAFSPDGKHVASASKDKFVKVWDAGTGEEVQSLKGHDSDVLRVAYSPDGKRIASAGGDGTLRVWNAADGTCERTLKVHGNWVAGVAFSADGKWIATASADKTAAVWDAATGATRRLHRPFRRGVDRGFPPGRQDRRQRRQGQGDQPVGRRHQRCRRDPGRPHQRGLHGDVRRAGDDAGELLVRRHGAAVGRGQEGTEAQTDRPQGERVHGGVRRRSAVQAQGPTARPGRGTRRRARNSHSCRRTSRTCTRWP